MKEKIVTAGGTKYESFTVDRSDLAIEKYLME